MVIIDLPGVTVEQYDQLNEVMGVSSAADVAGLTSHVAGQTDDGLLIVDVWESPEEFAAFAESQIAPAAQESGPPPFEPRFVPVHNHMHA